MSSEKVAELVSSKISNRNKKVDEVVKAEGEDSENLNYVFIDLDLYLDGLKSGLEAYGHDTTVVEFAIDENNAERELREKRNKLKQALAG